MKKTLLLFIFLSFNLGFSQSENFIDQPYVETTAKVDTLVTPDRIYLKIVISEKDSKGKFSVDELDEKLLTKLESLNINIKEQLTLNDVASNYKKYFLRSQDINITKTYTLLVYDAQTAGKVLAGLEESGISNVTLDKTEYSKIEELKMILRKRATLKAKRQAEELTQSLNKKVGSPLYISDGNSFSLDMLSGRVAGLQIRGMKSVAYSTVSVLNADIEFQKIKAQIDVNVIFKIE